MCIPDSNLVGTRPNPRQWPPVVRCQALLHLVELVPGTVPGIIRKLAKVIETGAKERDRFSHGYYIRFYIIAEDLLPQSILGYVPAHPMSPRRRYQLEL